MVGYMTKKLLPFKLSVKIFKNYFNHLKIPKMFLSTINSINISERLTRTVQYSTVQYNTVQYSSINISERVSPVPAREGPEGILQDTQHRLPGIYRVLHYSTVQYSKVQ